jgi:hypothetical protein
MDSLPPSSANESRILLDPTEHFSLRLKPFGASFLIMAAIRANGISKVKFTSENGWQMLDVSGN